MHSGSNLLATMYADAMRRSADSSNNLHNATPPDSESVSRGMVTRGGVA
jgi:hypothetical protein